MVPPPPPLASTAGIAAPSLNVYKKVAVIRLPSDCLTYEDAEGTQKSVSIEDLGDAISSAVSDAEGKATSCVAYVAVMLGRLSIVNLHFFS